MRTITLLREPHGRGVTVQTDNAFRLTERLLRSAEEIIGGRPTHVMLRRGRHSRTLRIEDIVPSGDRMMIMGPGLGCQEMIEAIRSEARCTCDNFVRDPAEVACPVHTRPPRGPEESSPRPGIVLGRGRRRTAGGAAMARYVVRDQPHEYDQDGIPPRGVASTYRAALSIAAGVLGVDRVAGDSTDGPPSRGPRRGRGRWVHACREQGCDSLWIQREE